MEKVKVLIDGKPFIAEKKIDADGYPSYHIFDSTNNYLGLIYKYKRSFYYTSSGMGFKIASKQFKEVA